MARDPKKKSAKKKAAKAKRAEENAAADEEGDEVQEVDMDELEPGLKVWQPGMGEEEEGWREEGMQLEFDPSAYDCLHAFRLEWPCLSMDILRDNLGDARVDWPHAMFMVAGTQAENPKANSIALMRVTSISKTYKAPKRKDGENDSDSDSESDEDMDEDEEGGARVKAGAPVLHLRQVAHSAGINRVRCCPQAPQIVASFSDNAHVQVWDLAAQVEQLMGEAAETARTNAAKPPVKQPPKQNFAGHADEGYALDWSPITHGRLLSGDCKGVIHLWEPTGGKWNVGGTRFKAPSGSGARGPNPSIEDLQWSPSEATVFASCSADQTVRIWDTRQGAAPALTVHAHNADVNVLSWSRLTTCMLASGGDDGTFRIWDLRNFKDDTFVAGFSYHKQPITSIEWSPFESPMVAVCAADNVLTVWDLSVERDGEEEAAALAASAYKEAEAPSPEDLPAQLMFVHQGQKDMKELHWHPQISGMLASTAGDGFNIFRPNNL